MWEVGVDKVPIGIAVHTKEVKLDIGQSALNLDMGLIDRKNGVNVKFRTARKWRATLKRCSEALKSFEISNMDL